VRKEQATHTSGDVLARRWIIKTRNNNTARLAGLESQRFVLIVTSERGRTEQLIRDANAGELTEVTIVMKGTRQFLKLFVLITMIITVHLILNSSSEKFTVPEKLVNN
jgi:hypothetical protein